MAKKSEEANGIFSGKIELRLRQFGRFCAWSLLVMVVLYIVTGFAQLKSGMIYNATGGLLNRATALWIHEKLTIPLAFVFICHSLIAIRFAMIRWQVKNLRVVNWVFLSVGAVLFGLTILAYLA